MPSGLACMGMSSRASKQLEMHLNPSRLLSTFKPQEPLSRLPIPSLDNLAKKFLASCKPLLSTDKFARTEAAVKAFIASDGLGPKLQNRLTKYERMQQNSWLENIWLKRGYLSRRAPLLANSNWWCAFVNHPSQPKDLLNKKPPLGVLSSFQIQRAAGIITNALNFKDLLDSSRMPPDLNKDTPLCMNQYRNLFGTTRIPGQKEDSIVSHYPSSSKHIVVLTNNQIYKVVVLRENGARVPLREIERLLYAVGQDSLETDPQPAVCILTATDRDHWYTSYSALSRLSPSNKANFETINQALFAVCLDDHASFHNVNASHLQMFHNTDGSNRWYDKAISFIISSSGQAGVTGEPTGLDASVAGGLMRFVVSHEPAVDPKGAVASPPLSAPQKLIWTTDKSVIQQIADAKNSVKLLAESVESCLLHTDIYGFRFIKEVAKVSPDAYVQLALQLTYYRQSGHVSAVSEPASTRAFKHGRTETVRSMSSETRAFVESFDDDEVLYDDKRALFDKAIATQSNYMKQASIGNGIDRHMLGLQSMLTDEEKSQPHMFSGAGFHQSQDFGLSTNNMSPGDLFYGGFGPSTIHGYGIGYAIDKDTIKFSISSRKESPKANAYKFRLTLLRTLTDMFILTEVWGFGWKEKHKQEKKDADMFKRMQVLSDKYRLKQKGLAKRYLNDQKSQP
ncbi:hypothetical protein BASA50_009647 [Batrachochytrium salamandrivorans]|uniref:Choline/carnitine acyltransferase domain-containing protein n=1 Tax=Batrachochytrium salamandrivorans TaxID=1357716 RepID=A0ABQ8F3B3_9FUNG|nr:hypothetical protein BASA50_009647 [Batrachochytrium salamandrivorans]